MSHGVAITRLLWTGVIVLPGLGGRPAFDTLRERFNEDEGE